MSEQTYLPANADSLARIHTAEAVGAIVTVMRTAFKEADRLRAAEMLIDRGHGRAVQAVISVPARQAVAARLAAMSDDALLQIAKSGRGSTPQKEGPMDRANASGTMPEPNSYLPIAGLHSADVVDAEFTDVLDYDPCS